MNSAQLYYSVACNQAEEQDKRRRHSDTIATTILAFSGALIAIMALTVSEWSFWSIKPAIAALIAFSIIATLVSFALLPRRWLIQPPLQTLWENIESGEYKDEILIKWTAKQISSAIEQNETRLYHKAKLLQFMYLFLITQVIALGVLVFSTVN